MDGMTMSENVLTIIMTHSPSDMDTANYSDNNNYYFHPSNEMAQL